MERRGFLVCQDNVWQPLDWNAVSYKLSNLHCIHWRYRIHSMTFSMIHMTCWAMTGSLMYYIRSSHVVMYMRLLHILEMVASLNPVSRTGLKKEWCGSSTKLWWKRSWTAAAWSLVTKWLGDSMTGAEDVGASIMGTNPATVQQFPQFQECMQTSQQRWCGSLAMGGNSGWKCSKSSLLRHDCSGLRQKSCIALSVALSVVSCPW